MSKLSRFVLRWSEEHHHYELYVSGELHTRFEPKDEKLWLNWLCEQAVLASFSFQGQAGRLRIAKEARSRGGMYWYAYSTHGRKAQKRYLGQTDQLSFARLEEVALAIALTKTQPPQTQHRSMQEMPFASPGTERVQRLLLETKFAPPWFSSTLVPRDRLLRVLDTVKHHHLLLLSAAAGSGKTRLLAAWAARASQKVAWLSLDALDNDPARFWTSLITALKHSDPDLATVGSIAFAMLQTPQPPALFRILTTLIHDFLEVSRDVFLVLDDYHVIENQAIHESLIVFVDALPDNLHLVLSSRIDPDLPLPRWRVRRQMAELRERDLRFTPEETADFLTQVMDLSLSTADIATLVQRTEGWIAGLQLVALSMHKSGDHSAFVRAISGSHRYLLDYMQQEILTRLPLALQDFLLQTSILDRLSAPLCQAVTEASTTRASQEMLEAVERANLFLIPLDECRQWYRFHDLFREGLLTRLRATYPTSISCLHIRAARWYEEQGEAREAITHALAASDFSYAVLLMGRVAEKVWLHGEAQTLYHWIMALPDTAVRDHTPLVLTSALYVLNSCASTVEAQRTRLRAQAEQMMTRVEDVFRQRDDEVRLLEEIPFLQQRLSLLREWSISLEAIMAGDAKRLQRSTQAMPLVDSEDEIIWQMVPLSNQFVLHYTFLREGGLLVPRLHEMKQRVRRDGNPFALIKVMQWLALASFDAGHLHQAYQECLAAQTLLQQIGGYAILAGYFWACQGDVLYQWNRQEEGKALQQKIILEASIWQKVDVEITAYLCLVGYALAAGDLVSAQQALQDAEQRIQQERLEALFHTRLITVQVGYWLATDDMAAASHWAAHAIFQLDDWDPNRKHEFLMLVRVYCARHQYTQAIEMLERFSRYFDRPGEFLATSAFLAVFALALHQGGQSKRASEILIRLLHMTELEGFIRVYLDEGEPMRSLLQALIESVSRSGRVGKEAPQEKKGARQRIPLAYVSTLLAAFRGEQSRPAPLERGPVTTSPHRAHIEHRPLSPSLMEPLTARERDVLHFLAQGASNQHIASQLVISLTTVKKHVSSLLAKLMVENRTQAVARARELSLL